MDTSNAKKTVLITGASSGIGMETALYFFERGWNTIATMRHPEKRRTPLHDKGLPDLVHLDVMDGPSIRAAQPLANPSTKNPAHQTTSQSAALTRYCPISRLTARRPWSRPAPHSPPRPALSRCARPAYRSPPAPAPTALRPPCEQGSQ